MMVPWLNRTGVNGKTYRVLTHLALVHLGLQRWIEHARVNHLLVHHLMHWDESIWCLEKEEEIRDQLVQSESTHHQLLLLFK